MRTSDRKPRAIGRVLAVSLALVSTGMLVGATIALALASLAVLASEGPAGFDAIGPFVLVAGMGAILGGMLGPLLAWTMLRRVPLGKAVVHCAVGGALGVVAGMLSGEMTVLVLWITGPLGAWLAARRLRRRYESVPASTH